MSDKPGVNGASAPETEKSDIADRSPQYKENQDTERNKSAISARRNTSVTLSAADRARRNLNAKLQNPLEEFSDDQLMDMGQDYCKEHAIGEPDDVRAFRLGAVLAKDPPKYDRLVKFDATPEELEVLEKEFKNRWSQPPLLYLIIVLCSTCAAVQGMDETVVNGAQLVTSTVLLQDTFLCLTVLHTPIRD